MPPAMMLAARNAVVRSADYPKGLLLSLHGEMLPSVSCESRDVVKAVSE